MQKIILYTAIVLVGFVSKLAAQENDSIVEPTEWMVRGNDGNRYLMGKLIDSNSNGKNIHTIKSVKEKTNGFGNLMKAIKSDEYLGKTIKMSCNVKSENVKKWAGLWMRVDYYDTNVLAFDNMQPRAIRGTSDWTNYEIVLFVPNDATSLSYGVLLNETGQIWFDDVILEVVSDETPETGLTKGRERVSLTFEEKAKGIASQIEMITTEEKKALKSEVEAIEKQLEDGKISKETADKLKLAIATERAENIETKVAIEEEKLAKLIQDKVDGKVDFEKKTKSGTRIVIGSGDSDDLGENQTEINLSSFKVYKGKGDYVKKMSKRTTSQFVVAFGLNNLITENESLNESDYEVWGSRFFEWGITLNTRILKNHNLLHAKYGLSLMYNNLRPTDNRYFVKNGDQTELQTGFTNFDDSKFKNVYLTAPIHLEFDFSPKKTYKDGKTYFRTHKSLRLGIGGYAGVRIKSKQILKYEEDDQKIKTKQKGDFNVSNFNYGLSTYIGYGQLSLYAKYDLNPLFKDNVVKQNNVSLGLRFDFN